MAVSCIFAVKFYTLIIIILFSILELHSFFSLFVWIILELSRNIISRFLIYFAIVNAPSLRSALALILQMCEPRQCISFYILGLLGSYFPALAKIVTGFLPVLLVGRIQMLASQSSD